MAAALWLGRTKEGEGETQEALLLPVDFCVLLLCLHLSSIYMGTEGGINLREGQGHPPYMERGGGGAAAQGGGGRGGAPRGGRLGFGKP